MWQVFVNIPKIWHMISTYENVLNTRKIKQKGNEETVYKKKKKRVVWIKKVLGVLASLEYQTL